MYIYSICIYSICIYSICIHIVYVCIVYVCIAYLSRLNPTLALIGSSRFFRPLFLSFFSSLSLSTFLPFNLLLFISFLIDSLASKTWSVEAIIAALLSFSLSVYALSRTTSDESSFWRGKMPACRGRGGEGRGEEGRGGGISEG